MYLPLANILHHKLRSVLSALGIGIGICMLITLSGLARGSLYEIADRWEAVDAELIAYPEIWGENLTTLSGVGLPDRYAERLRADHPDIVTHVTPVFLWQMRLGGQNQTVAGVDADSFARLVGGRELTAGRMFDPDRRFSNWLTDLLLTPAGEDESNEPLDIRAADLAAPAHDGLELVIDTRLADAGDYRVGQVVQAANHDFEIVGIVESGGLARVYMPRPAAQFLFGSGDVTKSTLIFVHVAAGVDPAAAARELRRPGVEIVQVRQYRGMLESRFGIMFTYVDAVNVIALLIAFLFIMITLYTMVLQQTRQIAILKSGGASNAFLLRQVLVESLLLTAAGLAVGVAMSLGAAWAIEALRPLLTVTITPLWVAIAAGAALAGALLSALYPAWRAAKVDVLETLTLE